MLGVKQDYDKVLRQRNTLLKSLLGTRPGPDDEFTIAIWDTQLVRLGSELLAARLDTLAELSGPTRDAYAAIAPVNNQTEAS